MSLDDLRRRQEAAALDLAAWRAVSSDLEANFNTAFEAIEADVLNGLSEIQTSEFVMLTLGEQAERHAQSAGCFILALLLLLLSFMHVLS